MARYRRSPRLIVALGSTGFLLFGARDGAIGVAWPSMRASFGQPLSALGLLLLASLAGYLLASTASGSIGPLIPVGRQLVVGSCFAILGLAVFGFAGQWTFLLGAACLLGVATGIVDVNLNAYLALHHRVATMNLVHAGWGVGTTAGPLLVTLSLAFNGSWRPAYVVLLVCEAVLLGGFIATRGSWKAPGVPGAGSFPRRAPSGHGSKLQLAATLVLFFAYTGMELGTGVWAYTFLVSGHGVRPSLAGIAVAAYWGALTGGRILASILGNRLTAQALLDVCLGFTMAGAVLVLLYPGTLPACAGLAIAGAGLGPVFPTLVSLTPARVGSLRTPAVIGYQLSAAALGGSVLSAAIGVALQEYGPRALGAIVPVGVAVLIVMRGMTRRLEKG